MFKDKIKNGLKKGFKIEQEENIAIMNYGIDCLTMNIVKTICAFIIAGVMGIFEPVALIFLVYGAIRFCSHGVHAEKAWTCMLWGMIIYIGGGLLAVNTVLNTSAYVALFVIFAALLIKYSPAGTEKRPIGTKEYRQKQILLLALLSSLFIAILFFNDVLFANVIIISIIAQAINVLPVTYKLMNQKYDNIIKTGEYKELDKSRLLTKDLFYSFKELFNYRNIADIMKDRQFRNKAMLYATSCCLVAITTFAVYTPVLLTIGPWWHNEPEMPESIRGLLR